MMSFGMERLEFRLHDFTRFLWVSDSAKEVWQPRIDRIMHCLQDIAWRAVVAVCSPAPSCSSHPSSYPNGQAGWRSIIWKS